MGAPSLREQAEQVFALIEDERHLAALELLGKVQERLDSAFTRKSSFRSSSKQQQQQRSWRRSSKRAAASKEIEEVQQLLAQKASTLDTLQKRCQLFQQALENVDGKNDEEWTLASSHFGIQTLYRREPDGSLSIKLEGELKDAPLFEQVCVLREFDLHCKWSPCCTASRTIANLGKLDTVGWFCIGSFGLLRDGCVRLIGCDHAVESGKVIVTGHGVRDTPMHMEDGDAAATSQPLDDPELLDSLSIPPIPTKKGTGRMTIRTLQAVIEVTSPTSATTKLVANMDPNVSILPNCLLELALKNIAGLVLLQMQGAARAVPKHPHSNPHAVRMRQDRAFYQDWLWPKCQRLCESHGWTMTPVHYFDESEQSPAASAVQQGPNITSHSQHATEKSMGGPAIAVTTPTSKPASDKPPHEASDRMDPLPATSSVDDGVETSTLNTGSTCIGTTVEEEGDTVASEWSKDSVLRQWLRHKKFPGARFLRQQRERRRARKAKQQQAVENPDNLRAQTLSAAQHARLAALQRANAARTASSTTLESQRTTHHHSTTTRVVVMSSLIATMAIALHPSLVWSSSQHDRPWATLISSDTEAILSIFLCAIPHFFLCDVGLLYAFDGLELGTKAGARTKAFYSDTVRYYMMVLSLGAAAVSVALAALHHAVCESAWVRRLGSCSAATTSWTDDAYGTARSLFFYSSLGLVCCVVFFYTWLRQRSQTEASSSSGVPKTITMLSRPPSSASTTASSEDEASLPQPQQS